MATPILAPADGILETAWQRIVREAREQVMDESERMEGVPPVVGAFIAWTECRYTCTDSLSVVHRVGLPNGADPYTTCGEAIPPRARWLSLSPGFIRSLGKCRFCEAEQSRFARESAA